MLLYKVEVKKSASSFVRAGPPCDCGTDNQSIQTASTAGCCMHEFLSFQELHILRVRVRGFKPPVAENH